MKMLCKKGKVHPSPTTLTIGDNLSFLTVGAALSQEDKEVLAYLISCCSISNNTAENLSGHNKTSQKSCCDGGCVGVSVGDGDHEPMFHCNCFRCYMSFWARWDKSPNRQLIHEIIEAYEEGLFREKRSLKKKKRRGKRASDESKTGDKNQSTELGSVKQNRDRVEEIGGAAEYGDKEEPEIKGYVSKIVSFVGERIWDILG